MHPKFTITKTTAHGRLGKIETAHGTIETPAFVFCATKGALKAQWPNMAREAGTQIILSNTYHLLVHPGSKLIHELGGLQKITGWSGPMMSDSGGYQIFSFGYGSVSSELKGKNKDQERSKITQARLKITEEGAKFRSYKNGSTIFLTPEVAMQSQIDFGVDLAFVLDECTAFNIERNKTEKSMHRSHRWATRSLEYFNKYKKPHQGAYSIIQGGVYKDLRIISTKFAAEADSFGIGIGGSMGENIHDMEEILKIIHKNNDATHKPIHLLGIGTIDAILMAVKYGIDTFDCVYPTRLARHGGALIKPHYNTIINSNKTRQSNTIEIKDNTNSASANTRRHYLNLRNAIYEKDNNPIDISCNCCTCATFSRAYIHMLLKADETLAIMALTQHNIAFMNRLMSGIRKALSEDTFEEFKNAWA